MKIIQKDRTRMANLFALIIVFALCWPYASAKVTEGDLAVINRLISNAEVSKGKCGLEKYPFNDLCRPCEEICGPQLDKTLCFSKCPVVYIKLFLIEPALNLLNPKIAKVTQYQSSQNASLQLLREFVNNAMHSGQQNTADFSNTYILYCLVGGLYILGLVCLIYSCRANFKRLFNGVLSSCHAERTSSQSSANMSQTTAVALPAGSTNVPPPALPLSTTAAAPVEAAAQSQQPGQMCFNLFPPAGESSETEEKVHPMSANQQTKFTNRGDETDPLVFDDKNGP